MARMARQNRIEPATWFSYAYTLLIVCLALAFTACGESPQQKRSEEILAQERVYTTSAADAATTLARLKAPAGFIHTRQCPGTNAVCFSRRRSMLLNRTVMVRLLASLGVKAKPEVVSCLLRRKRPTAPHLTFIPCDALVTFGQDRLFVNVISVVVATPTTIRSTTLSLKGGEHGTMIEIADVGH
jgi:hypothetical protein